MSAALVLPYAAAAAHSLLGHLLKHRPNPCPSGPRLLLILGGSGPFLTLLRQLLLSGGGECRRPVIIHLPLLFRRPPLLLLLLLAVPPGAAGCRGQHPIQFLDCNRPFGIPLCSLARRGWVPLVMVSGRPGSVVSRQLPPLQLFLPLVLLPVIIMTISSPFSSPWQRCVAVN